jgi:hypothetical protein
MGLMTQIRIGELYFSVRTGYGRINGEELSAKESCNLDLQNLESKVCFYKRNACQLLPQAPSCRNYSLVLRLQKMSHVANKNHKVCLRSYDPILNWEIFLPTFPCRARYTNHHLIFTLVARCFRNSPAFITPFTPLSTTL